MNVEIGTEAAQFPEKEYINGIVLAVQLSGAHHNPNLPGGSMKFIWWKLKKMSYCLS
jgi:hypothetical protein